ncbi:MAG TPA: hypothetical protein VI299_20005 [Polyangiales bacterium]
MLITALVHGGAGCSESEPRCGTLEGCDIRAADCQADALRYAVCLRGRTESTSLQVPVVVQTRADYVAERVAEAQAADTPSQRAFRRGLSLFQLSPVMSTAETEAQARARNVGATFRGDPARIVVIDDGYALRSGYVAVLVHEMVHALQQAAGELGGDVAPRYDAQLARSAVIEGEATIAQDETLAQGFGYDFDHLSYGKALSNYRAQNSPRTAWFHSTPFDNLYSQFSYAWGASYLWPLRRDQGAPAIASAHAAFPVSTYAVMGLDPSQPGQRPNDLGEQAVPVLPDLTLAATMHMGRFAYEVLRTVSKQTSAFPDGAHFVADTLSVFSSAEGTVLASWRFRFDDPSQVLLTQQWRQGASDLLPVGVDGADLWLIASEDSGLLTSLPSPLTFQAAPAADFGLDVPDKPAQIDCPRH